MWRVIANKLQKRFEAAEETPSSRKTIPGTVSFILALWRLKPSLAIPPKKFIAGV